MKTIEEIKNSKGERKYYKGFETYLTASGWARALDLPRMTVWQYLQQGLTPEEIKAKRAVKSVDLDRAPRKQRVGHRQAETFELVEELLDLSGYDPDNLEVIAVGGAFRHQIVWNDIEIGKYDPTKDWLKLTGGEQIKLRCPLIENQRIHHIDQVWYLTPGTKRARIDAVCRND